MTREELKAHCERQVEQCKEWAKHKGVEPSGKVYEEHKLVLELLEQETMIVPIATIKYDKDKLKELVKKEFKAVLTVAPQEPKTGNWFVDERPESDREIICSNCEQPIFKYHKMDFDYRPKYCPNCGAKMGSEDKR